MNAVKGMEYDHYTDSIYDTVECPECGMPIFGLEESDVGKEVECGCGEKVLIPDEDWVRKYIEDNTGHRVETVKCFSCGGKMIQHLYKRRGTWRVGHGECQDCGMRFIV